MSKGRRPALKALAGGLLSAPAMPLSLPADAAGDWQTTCADLQGRGLLQPAVLPLVEVYVGALAIARACRSDILRDGPTTRTAAGNLKPHPAASLLKANAEILARLAGELGLTAVARSRPGIREIEQKADADADPFARFDL